VIGSKVVVGVELFFDKSRVSFFRRPNPFLEDRRHTLFSEKMPLFRRKPPLFEENLPFSKKMAHFFYDGLFLKGSA
jgi:hypothetical protein